MVTLLDIITITRDDIASFVRTIDSTKSLREDFNINQIIIDSSIKSTGNKIKKIAMQNKNTSYYWQNPSGISSAFNYGLSLSKETWIWFLNGGDEVHPYLNTGFFLNLLTKSNADAIIFQLEYIQSSKTIRHPQMWATWPPLLSWIPHPSAITRRYLYNKYGYFDKSLKIAMDYEFWIRCFSKDVIVDLVSVPIARFNEEGASSKLNKQIKAEVETVIRRHFWLIMKKWLWTARIVIKSIIIHSKFYKGKISV